MKTSCLVICYLLLALFAAAQPATYNTAFGTNGRVYTNLAFDNRATASEAVLQPDGKILICGYMESTSTFCVVRIFAGGILDNSFGIGGTVLLGSNPYEARSLALQSDGKILVTGSDDSAIVVYRLNINGSLDNSYNGTGKASISIPNLPLQGNKLAIQSDGKAVVVGSTSTAMGHDIFITRLLTNGVPDNTFNGNGKRVITGIAQGGGGANGVAFQSNGKIVITGGIYQSPGDDLFALRLNTNGSSDNTFNGTGTYIYSGPYQDFGEVVAVQPDDKIIIGGISNGHVLIIRLTTNGTADNSFASSGIADITFGITNQITNVILKSSGKIIFTGNNYVSNTTGWDFSAMQLNSDGSLDAGFNGSGSIIIPVSNDVDHCRGSILQSDGKLVLTGFSNQYFLMTLARVNGNGTIDNTFGSSGIMVEQINPSNESANGFIVQPDNKIILAGNKQGALTFGPTLVRYLQNGKVDSSFGQAGMRVLPVPTFKMESIFLRPDSKMVLTGTNSPTYPGSNAMAIVRIDALGNLDNSYNGTGVFIIPNDSSITYAHGSAQQPDGKMVLAGTVENNGSSSISVARVNSNGGMDATFGVNGKVTVYSDSLYSDPADVALQNDGKILMAGDVQVDSMGRTIIMIARLNPDGSFDNSFNLNGKKFIDLFPNAYNYANKIAVQPDGKILIAAETDLDSIYLSVFRLNSDGSFDNTFNTTGYVLFGANIYGLYGSALSIGSQGEIYYAGTSYDSSNISRMMVEKITANGRIDSSFSSAGNGQMLIDFNGYRNSVNAMGIKADGSLLLVGDAGEPSPLISSDFAAVSIVPAVGILQLCPGANASLSSNITGASYQWQLNSGASFTNISDNAVYSGTHTAVLGISATPASYYGYKYRCAVGASFSNILTLTFVNHWNGSVSTVWENPANWNCGSVPDLNTDVVVNGSTVVLNSNTTIRTLTLQGGASVTVTSGHVLTILH